MKITAEWVGAYFSHGIDVANRRIFIGEIDDDSVDAVVRGMYLMETERSDTPIELFINSPGGCIYGALAIHDICQTLKSPISTFGFGIVMSSALILLASGRPGHRWVSESCQLMQHDGSDALEGKTTSLKADMKHLEHLEKVWTNLLVRYSTKDYRWWDSRAQKSSDFYFTAEQAIDYGIADHIWDEKG